MLKLTRRVLCLDWDKRSLRLVGARVAGGKMVLEDAHSHRLPNTVDADDPQAMGEFIQQMARRHGLRTRTAVVDVSRERAVINRLAMPPTPTEEVAAAVRFQAMRELPFPVDSAAVDYVITERDDDGNVIEVLLAAVTRETLERVKATCLAAGLTPTRIGLRPYANLVAAQRVRHPEDDARRLLFVDVGPGATEIDIFEGEALAFARSANVNVPVPTGDSGSREDSRIISLAEIADLDSADEAIEAAVHELLVEVTRTLQAYRATEPDAAVDAVIVAGGTGIEPQFAEALYRRLGVEAELFDPTGPLEVEPDESPKLRSFSAALGLAWGLGREGLLALDFLNPKRPVSSQETLRRRAKRIGTGIAAILVIAAGAYGKYYWDLSTQLADLEQRTKELKEEVDQRRAILYQVQRVEDWEVDAMWPEELLAIAEAAVEPGKQMLVQSIDCESTRRNQRIALRNVYTADAQIWPEFVKQLNDYTVDNERVFLAIPRGWQQETNLKGFAGKLDIDVELLRLAEHEAEREKREKQRKRAARRRGR